MPSARLSCFESARQRGNALFLILIAVALFAALSYAVTQTGRGSGGLSRETAELAAAQIISYAGDMEQAVNRMRLINGCSDTDISFETPSSLYDFTHTPPVSTACMIFNANGGGITYNEFNASYYAVDAAAFRGWLLWGNGEMSVYGAGSGAAELAVNVLFLKKEICEALNRHLGLPLPDSFPSAGETVDAWIAPFQGGYGTPVNPLGDENSAWNKSSFCVYDSDNSRYVFTHAILVR